MYAGAGALEIVRLFEKFMFVRIFDFLKVDCGYKKIVSVLKLFMFLRKIKVVKAWKFLRKI
jgi:hypothetical protein